MTLHAPYQKNNNPQNHFNMKKFNKPILASEKRGRALNSTFKWDTEIMMLVVSSMFDNV